MKHAEAERIRKLAMATLTDEELIAAFESALAKCDPVTRWEVELALANEFALPGLGSMGRLELAGKIGMWLSLHPHVLDLGEKV